MEKFVIEGGYPLSGEFTPSGNKNAVLPMLAACLLTEEPVLLHNVPDIQDVQNMRKLIMSLGVQIDDLGAGTMENSCESGSTYRSRSRSMP